MKSLTLDVIDSLIGAVSRCDVSQAYLLGGHNKVEGWFEPGVLPILTALDCVHHQKSIVGGVLEIGVHHGRFFIALLNACSPDQPMVAVDLFDAQEMNVDNSGNGDRKKFLSNVGAYSNKHPDDVTVIKSDSLGLCVGVTPGLEPGRFRLLSIDGGHTGTHTYNDLLLAEKLISDGGVVIVDDIMHMHWLGVMEGVVRYRLHSPGVLVPFLISANKMFMCKASHHTMYLNFFARHYPLARKKTYKWLGEAVTVGQAPAFDDTV